MTRPTPQRLPVGTGQWVCDVNAVVCRFCDTMMAYYKDGFRANAGQMSGPMPVACYNCKPHTYFMLLYQPLPSPIATCYPLSRESYVQWDSAGSRYPPVPELLYHMRDPQGRSYNPYWQPPTAREHR